MISIFEPERILSSAEGARLAAWVDRVIESGTPSLLIDFRKTSFMDSSGLGALILTLKKARASQRQLALCSLNGQARMLLELAEVEDAFEIYSNRQEFEQRSVASSAAK